MADFDWEEYLDLAEELVRRHGDVPAERSAISRAYCAAFHQARAYFVRQGQRLTLSGDDHVLIWDWFLRPTAPRESQRVGRNGRWLRQARRRADYDSAEIRGLTLEAATAVALARSIIVDLRRLR